MTITKVEKYIDLKAELNRAEVNGLAGTPPSPVAQKAAFDLPHVKEWCEDAEKASDWKIIETSDFLKRRKQGSNEEKGAQSMQVSLYAYAKVMRKRMCDIVPQMVHTALVADVAQRLQPHLLASMTPERLQTGAVDNTALAKRRAAAEQRVKNFMEAEEQLNNICVSPSA